MPPKKNPNKRPVDDNIDSRAGKVPRTDPVNSNVSQRNVNWILASRASNNSSRVQADQQIANGFAPSLFGTEWRNLHNVRLAEVLNLYPLLRSPVLSADDISVPRFDRGNRTQDYSAAYHNLYTDIRIGINNIFVPGRYASFRFIDASTQAQRVDGAVIVRQGGAPFATEDAVVSVAAADGNGTRRTFRLFRVAHHVTQSRDFFIRLEPGDNITINDVTHASKPDANHDGNGSLVIGPLPRYCAIEFQSQPIFYWHAGAGQALFENLSARVGRVTSHNNEVIDEPPENIPVQWHPSPNSNNPNHPEPGSSRPPVGVDTNRSLPDDPCAYFRQTIDDLKLNPDISIKKLGESLELKDIFNAVASVTQAVSSVNTHANDRSHCFGHINFDTLASFVGNSRSASDYRMVYQERPLLFPWRTENGHTYLVVTQRDTQIEKPQVKIRVVDTMPWNTNLDRDVNSRRTTFARVRRLLRHVSFSVDPEELNNFRTIPWVTPTETDAIWKAECLAILYAWTIALDLILEPNFRGANLPDEFFSDFRDLLAVVLHGLADWRLIWAFLRCKNFIDKTRITREYRITRTIHVDDLDNNLVQMRQDGSRLMRGDPRNEYMYSLPQIRQRHRRPFPTDDWTQEDRDSVSERHKTQDPTQPLHLISSAQLPKQTPNPQQSPVSQQQSPINVPPPQPPSGPSPCDELRQKLDERLNNSKIQDALRNLRSKKGIHYAKADDLFGEEDVNYAIGPVVLSITRMNRSDEAGFGFLLPMDVQFLTHNNIIEGLYVGTPRSLQPLFYVYSEGGHHVLHVVQYNSDGVPTISCYDSIRNTNRRATLHGHAVRIVKGAWQLVDGDELPKESVYQRCAIQSTNHTCGAHAILNAWALALDLEINPNFIENWSPASPFRQDFLDVTHLTRIGEADWSLISAFLRCYKFVETDGYVPIRRRFAKSIGMIDDEGAREVIRSIKNDEPHAVGDPSMRGREKIRVRIPADYLKNHQDQCLPGAHERIFLGIASVIEAIDRFQKEQSTPNSPFAANQLGMFSAGFALSSAYSIIKISKDPRYTPTERVSRARRCWFLPMVRGLGPEHYLLILQEEPHGGSTQFKTYVAWTSHNADSMGEDQKVEIRNTARRIARLMKWSTHQNLPEAIVFAASAQLLPVAKHGSTEECDSLTILNAWIFALGLRPNSRKDPAKANELDDIRNIIDSALLGRLSWNEIFNFLRTRQFIVDTSTDSVPVNRRFLSTVNQKETGDRGLEDRLREHCELDDDILSSLPSADAVRYYRGNNLTPDQVRPDNQEGLSRELEFSDEDCYENVPDYEMIRIEYEMARAKKKRKSSLLFLDAVSNVEFPSF